MSQGEPYKDRKIINWPEYNQALIKRGSVTFWLDEEAIANWYSADKRKPGRGQYTTFSDNTLQTCLMIGLLYGLSRRATQGFVNSLFELMNLPHRAPNYTIYSKARGRHLEVRIPRRLPKGPVDVVCDSTGLKVYGEGEWKVRKHGVGKRRVWRKLHLGVNPDNHDIIAAELTTLEVGDAEVLPDLLDPLPEEQAIGDVPMDGAYDTHQGYDSVLAREGNPIVPPRKGAVEWEENHPRTQAVRACQTAEERKAWKKSSGYHRRSLSETAMYRYKTLIGRTMRARNFDGQNVEALAAIAVLNRINTLGMPVRS